MSWLKDSETVKASKRAVISTSKGFLKLFVVTVDDAGKYTCVYNNEYGEDRKTAMLLVDGMESGPRKFITGGV